jgi:hypothetical protein
MQEEAALIPQKKDSKLAKWVKLLVKLAITIACFWYISTKIDLDKALDALGKAKWWFLFLAVITLVTSKIFSAFRLNIYFRNIGLHLPEWRNIKLYWLGMFYNLFLPGAISGDAYKVVILNKRYKSPYKKTSVAILMDRFSGLLALGVILCIYGLIVLDNDLYNIVLVTGCLLSVIVSYLVIRHFFNYLLPVFWPTFFWGLAVQGVQVICIYCLLAGLEQVFTSMNMPAHQPEWIFIFLLSAVITVLPISLGGGLGTREFIFVEGANFFHLDPHVALIISLLFYLSSVVASAWGAWFVFNDPLAEGGSFS